MIRSHGLYHYSAKANPVQWREILGELRLENPESLDRQTLWQGRSGQALDCCPVCIPLRRRKSASL